MSQESKSVVKTTKIYKAPHDKAQRGFVGAKLGVDAEKLRRLEKELEGIEGQEYACQCIKEYLFGINHRSHEKGLGGLLVFAGAPAVGKTMIGEKIAGCLGLPMYRIDMSTKNDKESSVFEMIGIHPSYKAAEEGEVTGFVKSNPSCVLLLDELEKAHINVLNALLQMFERGEIVDKFTKRVVSFRDAIVIITTNVGKDIYNQEIGKFVFSQTSPATIKKAMQTETNPLTNVPFFTEALVSRFFSGKVIMFNKLRPEVVHRIVTNDIKKQTKFFEELYGIRIDLDPSRLAELLILSQGEGADIRTLLKSSQELFSKCMGCGVETATDANAKTLFQALGIKISYDDATEETKKLLHNKNKSRLLVYCQGKDKKSFTAYESDRVEFCFIDDTFDIREVGKQDLTAVIIDVEKRDDSFARELFDCCTGEESIPTYVYNTKKVGRSFFYYYVDNGASECFSPKIGGCGLESFVGKIVNGLDLSYLTKELFRSGKVISYDTDYTYSQEGDSIEISLHKLRIEAAMDARDQSQFVAKRDIPNVSYDDVIGADTAKAELKRASKFLLDYKRYLRQGIRIPRGILLDGEPGTGKTMLAKAFASQAGVPFIQKNATEFLIKWIGDGAKAIRELFASARRYAPCVVFIDEIDIIAKSRTDNPGDNHHTHNLTNAFLSEMDGFSDNTRAPVFVICATNFDTRKGSTQLDEAFLRRFDKKIHVELPKQEQREEFLEKVLGKVEGSLVTREAISIIAKRSVGWSLADLNMVVQNALRKYEDEIGNVGIDNQYLTEEFECYHDGEKKKSTEQGVRKTAIHEAGHAVVGNALGIPSVFTTIIGRGSYGGYVYFADEDKTTYTKNELLSKICMALGGRAAEVLEFGEAGINTGASGDIKSASDIAMSMLCDYGMMEDSLLFFTRGKEPDFVIEKAQALLNQQYERAKKILEQKMDKLHIVADALIEKNSLSQEEMEGLLAD